MKYQAVAIIVLALAAATLPAQGQQKERMGSVGPLVDKPAGPQGGEGGETIADATVITSIPFVGTGDTSDNIHDYDEVCPYGSLSPDVVYTFTPDVDGLVDLSLCSDGNRYDTKLYVYEDQAYNIHACNDDYCANSWTTYASYIGTMPVQAGHTYIIIVDGYGGDAGMYELRMDWSPDCPDICTEDAVPENEPPLVDDYIDNYNGGCASSPPVFQEINWVNSGDGCSLLCGTSGWYDYYGAHFKDRDAFRFIADGDVIDITITAEKESRLIVFHPVDCAEYSIVADEQVWPCNETSLSVPTSPGAEYAIHFTPANSPFLLEDYTYYLRLCGIQSEIVPTESITWSRLKAMYD